MFLSLNTGLAAEPIAKPQKLTSTISWEITADGVLRITGYGEMPDFKWDKDKFKHWRKKKYFPNSINRIEIDDNITYIGSHAFYLSYDHDRQISPIPVTLPNNLKKIGSSAFEKLKIDLDLLPDRLEEIGSYAFSRTDFKMSILIIPPSVKEISSMAFYGSNVSSIIIQGNPTIGFRVFKDCDKLEQIAFTDPLFRFNMVDKSFKEIYNVAICVQDESIVPDELKAYNKIISPNLIAKEEKDKNVNGYIANRIQPWETFISGKQLPAVWTEQQAKADIERQISTWQRKGEFESTSEWKSRVNEKTRARKLAELTTHWNNKAKKSQQDYNEAVERYREEYKKRFMQLQKEFYVNLAKRKLEEYASDSYDLSPYDADNQTFLIRSGNHGDFLLQVDRNDAQDFKENWSKISKNIDFSFVPISETEVGLKRIFFMNGNRKYIYDGKTDAEYSVAEINYNFTPLEVTGLSFEGLSLPELANAPTVAKTVRSKGVETRKVTVNHTIINASNANPIDNASVAPDVDVKIPDGYGDRENTFALIIANENYRRVSPVNYAANDGEIFSKYVNKTLRIPGKNILYTRDASLNDMKYQLKRISDICSSFEGDASVIVYYAGHGVPDEKSANAYLLPVDGYAEDVTTGLSMRDLIDTLSEIPSKQVILFIDACFSGINREGKPLYAARGVALRPKPISPRGNLIVFSAAQGVETAQPYHEKKHGLFTYFLLNKLKETKGNVTLGELSDYINENVMRTSVVEGKRQTPSIHVSPTLTNWQEKKL